MTNPPTTGPPRSALIAVVLALSCAVALVLSIDPALSVWMGARAYVLMVTLLPGLLLALACAGFGDALLRLGMRIGRQAAAPDSSVDAPSELILFERLLLAFACGIGVLSSGVFLLGITGVMNQMSSIILLFAGLICGLPIWNEMVLQCKARIAHSRRKSHTGATFPATFTIFLIAVSIALIAAVSVTPPIIFDVTEYHLGAWTDYYMSSTGVAHFVPMPHNFYARFPFPIESLYFLSLSAAPYTDSGPKVFNAICVVLCGLLAALMARRLGAGRAGKLLAALVTIAHPVMFDVSIDALIDAPTALLVASGVFAAFIAGGVFPYDAGRNIVVINSTVPSLVVPGFFLFGTALAAKYTVAQIYLLPWLVLALPLLLKSTGRRFGFIVIAMGLASVPCLLWLGKNVVYYGNPLEPFFIRWFRPSDAGAIVQEKFYIDSHFPQSPISVQYWMTLVPRLREFQAVILVACAGWMFRDRRAAALRVVVIAALAWLCWNTVRDSQNRFLLPAMVLLAPVAVCGALSFPTRLTRRFVAALLVLFSLAQVARYSLTVHQSAIAAYLINFAPTTRATSAGVGEPTAREEFNKENLGDLGEIVNQTNRALPANAKMLFIYEARPYLFHHDTVYNVVWDDSVLLDIIRPATSTAEAWTLLREAGITHVLVNRQELIRYIQQYARPSQLRPLGVRRGEDPRVAWSATAHPENLYPPFFLDPDWERLRPLVHTLLHEIDSSATFREGVPAPDTLQKSLEITVSPIS